MTEFITPTTSLPCYMAFPRFLLGSGLNETAMLTYVILLDRARLSMSNPRWVDENGYVFLHYSIRDLAAVMSKSDMTVKTALAALERQRLIVRRHQGIGRLNRIYVLLPADSILSAREKETCPPEGKNPVPPAGRKLSGNKNDRTKTIHQEQQSKVSAYGQFQNVFLSQDELSALRKDVPSYKEYIERLSGYMASTGKTYRNHAATIRSWVLRDKPAAQTRNYDCKESESL